MCFGYFVFVRLGGCVRGRVRRFRKMLSEWRMFFGSSRLRVEVK